MITSLALLALTMGPPAALALWLLSKCPSKTREEWTRDMANQVPSIDRNYSIDRSVLTPGQRIDYAKQVAARRELQEEARRAREAADQEFQ